MDPSSGSSTDQYAYRNDRNVHRKDCSGGFKWQQGSLENCIICITSWPRNSPDFVYALGGLLETEVFFFYLCSLLLLLLFSLCVYVRVCVYLLDIRHVSQHICEDPRTTLGELVLSFQLCGDQILIVRLVWQLALPTEPFSWLKKLSL